MIDRLAEDVAARMRRSTKRAPLIVISGIDGSGKSTLAPALTAALRERHVRAAVVTVDLRIVAPTSVKNAKTPASHAYAEGPRYASLKGIMAAKKKEIKEVKLADLGVTAAAKVKLISVEAPPPRKAGIKVADVNELVKRLAEDAKVL